MSEATERGTEAEAKPRVEVQCLSCGRQGWLDGEDRRLSGATLVALTRRLRCSECGSRAVKARMARTPRDVARLLRSRMDTGRGGEKPQ